MNWSKCPFRCCVKLLNLIFCRHMSTILRCCISKFCSPSWSVRNAALQLFGWVQTAPRSTLPSYLGLTQEITRRYWNRGHNLIKGSTNGNPNDYSINHKGTSSMWKSTKGSHAWSNLNTSGMPDVLRFDQVEQPFEHWPWPELSVCAKPPRSPYTFPTFMLKVLNGYCWRHQNLRHFFCKNCTISVKSMPSPYPSPYPT